MTKRTLQNWLSWQESSHPKAWDLGLTRIGEVWLRLNPAGEKIAGQVITVAGTNGKGSCVRWIEAICRAHGVTVAAFTSPHLRDYRERIRFNGDWVSAADLVAAFEAIDAARGEISLTYFEWSALAMFYLTWQRQPAVAVLEVGLGGRLDATNLIDADAAIITRIGLDHQDWLGNDRETIAREKAGIMRAGQRVFLTDEQPPQALCDYAAEIGARVHFFGRDFAARAGGSGLTITLPQREFQLPLPIFMTGKHQFAHLAAVIYALQSQFAPQADLLAEVTATTENEGRLMHIAGAPEWLLDVAHNPDSAEILAEHLAAIPRDNSRRIAICGMLKDKDQAGIFSQLRDEIDDWLLISLAGTRGSSAAHLWKEAAKAGILVPPEQLFADLAAALTAVKRMVQPSDKIIIFGSFVTVSAALEELNL